MKDFLKLGVMGRICHVVPVSEPLGADVAERGCPRNRIHVISNGIDVAHATERRKSREQLRQELGIPDSSGVLLGFGWTPVRKAVDLMLKAHAKLAAEGRHLMLVLVGTEELEKFAAGWPERKFASLLRVVPPSEYVGELFAACDVFLSPSRAEGFTYSIGEALVNGTPVVCSDIPTVGWARNAPGVHFCRAGDPDDLARVLRHVLDLPQAERQASAELGRKFIAEKYSAEEWGRSVWKLYEQLLGVRDSQRQIAARPMKEVRH